MKLLVRKMLIACVLLALCCLVFPFDRITDLRLVDNPQGCRYYIPLQSLLTDYQTLANDPASMHFIEKRLQAFHNDLQHAPDSIRNEYDANYAEAMRHISPSALDVITLAHAVYPVIDRFYLDERLFCKNVLYDYDNDRHDKRMRMVMRQNLSGLYENLAPYKAILCSWTTWILGATPGLMVNNQTMTFDTRYMTGIPLISALYILPKFHFDTIGAISSPLPMRYFTAASFSDPVTRKVLDIAGIDVFTLRDHEVTKPIPHTAPLVNRVDSSFNPGFISFINQDSYGLTYLANHITYARKAELAEDEREVRRYFHTHQDMPAFLQVTDNLYSQLLSLKDPHDIIVESDKQLSEVKAPAGEVKINGVVGERAMFTSHCNRTSCQLVFNLSAAPGWHAYVNGEPQTVERANFAFLSTEVKQGVSTVWFIYEPFIEILGDFLSLISLIVFSISLVHFSRPIRVD